MELVRNRFFFDAFVTKSVADRRCPSAICVHMRLTIRKGGRPQGLCRRVLVFAYFAVNVLSVLRCLLFKFRSLVRRLCLSVSICG
jgi:hypothetical protein